MTTTAMPSFRLVHLLRISYCFALLLCLHSCQKANSQRTVFDYAIDTSMIPKDTIHFSAANVSFVNGLYLLNGKAYSGIVIKILKGYNVKTYNTVLNGQRHGTYRSYYESGKPYEVRQYKHNKTTGKQYAYWEESGRLKFEYNYYQEKKEGAQKSWYANGNPCSAFHYIDDRQEGLQRSWRENGSLYRNFMVRDNIRYGLQKTAACVGLKEEIVQ